MDLGIILVPAIALAAGAILTSLRVMYEYERGVIFRLGKLTRAKGPGLIVLVPFGIDRLKKMDLRIVALDIAPQDTITKDNVSVRVNAVVYFRVVDPTKAVIELLAERERINEVVRVIIDEGTDRWGVEVTGVEIKDIDLPQEMKRAMAKQAEAERERRARVINAQGEYQASTKLVAAAEIIQQFPGAMQLRFLQTVAEIAVENNSTTLFPIPIDLFSPFVKEGQPVSPEAQQRALKAATDAMISTLPDVDGTSRSAIEGVAKTVLGAIEAGQESPEPASVGDGEKEE